MFGCLFGRFEPFFRKHAFRYSHIDMFRQLDLLLLFLYLHKLRLLVPVAYIVRVKAITTENMKIVYIVQKSNKKFVRSWNMLSLDIKISAQ